MPVQAPIDYTIDVKNPFMQGLQAYRVGQQEAAAIEAENAQQMANFERKKAMADFAAMPNKTAQDYIKFLEANPDLYASYKDVYSMRSDQWKKADIMNAQRVHALLSTGQVEKAKEDIKRQIEANRNSGNEAEAQSLEMILEQAEMNPEGAEMSSGLYLAATQDPNAFIENMKTIEENRQTMQLQPGAIEKQRLENIQAGIDLGLSQIDAEKKQKEIDKLDAETQKILMEMEGLNKSGGLTPEKKVDLEQKLADKYYSRNADYLERFDYYNNIIESAKLKSGPGDYALIKAFNKILEPGSAVLDGEFAKAEASSGRLAELLNFFKKFKDGDLLRDETRAEFVATAKKFMDSAEKAKNNNNQLIEKTIDAYGLNRDVVLPKEQEIQEPPKTFGGPMTSDQWRKKSINERVDALQNIGP